ncbi:MAG: phytoene/squalene synthase family protein [Candidatus Puniceispirillum sp.]
MNIAQTDMHINEELPPEMSLARNGKSFNWAKHFLGQEMGRDAAQLYSFCRLLDDMADGDIPHGSSRLAAVRDGLMKARPTADRALTDFYPFMQEKNIDCDVVLALIDGLLQDQNVVALETEDELLRYSYCVAGTVGLMMCKVLNCHNPAALAHAIDLGIAMQLTNIARDVLEDATMRRRYVPATWVGNMTADDILATSRSADTAKIDIVANGINRLLALAEIYYESGRHGLAYLPLRAHISIAVALQVYRQIGVQLKNRGTPWQNGRQHTSIFSKFICTSLAMKSLVSRPMKRPVHDKHLHRALAGLPHVS